MNNSIANCFSISADQNNHEHNITEIVVASGNPQALLMPIIAALSQQNSRWLTWITNKVPSKKQLLDYCINLQTLRLIYINHQQEDRWLTWEALAQGNSHTVITEMGKLTRRDIQAMENAARQGNTQGIIIRRQ